MHRLTRFSTFASGRLRLNEKLINYLVLKMQQIGLVHFYDNFMHSQDEMIHLFFL